MFERVQWLTQLRLIGEKLGRITMELFANVVPRTAENFRQFCTGELRGPEGKAVGYRNCRFHRIVSARVLLPFLPLHPLAMLQHC